MDSKNNPNYGSVSGKPFTDWTGFGSCLDIFKNMWKIMINESETFSALFLFEILDKIRQMFVRLKKRIL
jgi:hypothetical protein